MGRSRVNQRVYLLSALLHSRPMSTGQSRRHGVLGTESTRPMFARRDRQSYKLGEYTVSRYLITRLTPIIDLLKLSLTMGRITVAPPREEISTLKTLGVDVHKDTVSLVYETKSLSEAFGGSSRSKAL